MSSNRTVPEQFGRGITVDSTRVEANIETLLDNLNSVDPRYQQRRWIPTCWSAGHQSPAVVAPSTLPWLRWYNPTDVSTIEPPTTFQNPYRTKNCLIEGITTSNGALYGWSASLYLTRPTILSQLTCWLAVDSVYANTLVYGATPPPKPQGGNYVNGDPVEDLTVMVTVDNYLDTEKRALNAVEAVQYRFAVDRSQISFRAINPAWDTMQPDHPAGALTGLAVEIPVLRLLPENARVRIEVIIPLYNPGATTSGWGLHPTRAGVYNFDLQLLEAF